MSSRLPPELIAELNSALTAISSEFGVQHEIDRSEVSTNIYPVASPSLFEEGSTGLGVRPEADVTVEDATLPENLAEQPNHGNALAASENTTDCSARPDHDDPTTAALFCTLDEVPAAADTAHPLQPLNIASREQPNPEHVRPNPELYGRLSYAQSFFNDRLFGGKLPECLVTLRTKGRSASHLASERYRRNHDGRTAPEISLNSTHFAVLGDREICAAIVRRQVDLVCEECDGPTQKAKSASKGYRGKRWAALMKHIGLEPIAASGKATGYSVRHTIASGGPFDRACTELLESGFRIDWFGTTPVNLDQAPKPTRARFECSGACGLIAYAKHSASLICGTCMTSMKPQ